MARVKAIRQALVNSLKAVPELSTVKTWHMVDGFVPSRKHPTGSVGTGRTVYDQLDNEWDRATTEIPVYITVVDPDPVRAEDVVQELGEDARMHLIADDPTLGDVVRTTDVPGLDFTTAMADKELLIHFITLQVSVTHLVPRIRPATEPPADAVAVETQT